MRKLPLQQQKAAAAAVATAMKKISCLHKHILIVYVFYLNLTHLRMKMLPFPPREKWSRYPFHCLIHYIHQIHHNMLFLFLSSLIHSPSLSHTICLLSLQWNYSIVNSLATTMSCFSCDNHRYHSSLLCSQNLTLIKFTISIWLEHNISMRTQTHSNETYKYMYSILSQTRTHTHTSRLGVMCLYGM